MKKTLTKNCQGCEQEFTLSTANDEVNFCSQLCERGQYYRTLKGSDKKRY